MPIFTFNPDDAAKHVRTVQDASALVAKLQERHGELQAAIGEIQAGLRTAALAVETGGDSKAYDKALGDLDRLKRDHMRTADALAAARQELLTAERALAEATRSNRTKEAEKLCAQRLKHVQGLVAAIDAAHREHQKLHDVELKLLGTFESLAVNHGGTLLSINERLRALEAELARVSSPPPLDSGACPALPGARSYSFGNPASAEPLMAVMEAANAVLIRLVSADAATSQAPAMVDEDDAILALPPDNAGQTVDAGSIMPAARKLAV